ncbi:MAG: Ethanolamine-phosphate cytidylyltransferase [Icmadophila ericetorum]|nr:Ethanolamine-phosphate cytidylyltransferase [Icmadophila ericetorum]
MTNEIPKPGDWPVDPQNDVAISKDRLWLDGCFDFSHHGHAGAMLQAKRLGKELLVGIHSDEAILENKGPTVMTLKERVAAVEACRWSTLAVPHAPYVTQLSWISHYGCWYVVHGDDITSDSNGEDCYRFVKAAGRFLIVKRTPGISTTDLVGRMLLCTKGHFINSLTRMLAGEDGTDSDSHEGKKVGAEMLQRIKEYASDETGLHPGSDVWSWRASITAKENDKVEEEGSFSKMVEGKGPRPGQRVVYVDGGFDLFSSGHIEFLRQVNLTEEGYGREDGWFSAEIKEKRIAQHGENYGPAFIVAGVHDDEVINHWKGLNYPIMNIFERGLCVLQCRYVQAVIFSAPFSPTHSYLSTLPYGIPSAVYHGPTKFMPLTYNPYVAAQELGIFKQIQKHEWQDVNAEEIVGRIMEGRSMFEERQRRKEAKSVVEEEILTTER